MVLPSDTNRHANANRSSTFTPTFAATTFAPTASPLSTLVPTLSERVLEVTVVMPGIVLPSAPTEFPYGTVLLSAPPQPVEPLPDATDTRTAVFRLVPLRVGLPNGKLLAALDTALSPFASRGQYHHTETASSSASFVFEGEGLRVRYVAAQNMGSSKSSSMALCWKPSTLTPMG